MSEEFRLCYIDGSWAWFTTQDVKEQWGDDWNDAPYEHNAGSPYAYTEHDQKAGKAPWKLQRVAWDGPFETPCSEVLNSPWDVQRINQGAAPWLVRSRWNTDLPYVAIMAGATLEEFRKLVGNLGGNVYESTSEKGKTV